MPDLHNEGDLEAHTLQGPSAVQPHHVNAAVITSAQRVIA